jgi:hypothetical protein
MTMVTLPRPASRTLQRLIHTLYTAAVSPVCVVCGDLTSILYVQLACLIDTGESTIEIDVTHEILFIHSLT